jgi:predicted site-specific integrase-resolvase
MDKQSESSGPPRLGWRVNEYCELLGISRGTLYNRLREGRGPRIMKVGGRTIITAEAHQAYRIRCESGNAA